MKRVKKRRVNNLWSWLWDMSWTFGVDVTLSTSYSQAFTCLQWALSAFCLHISHCCLIFLLTLGDVWLSLSADLSGMFIMQVLMLCCFWLFSRCTERTCGWAPRLLVSVWSEKRQGPTLFGGSFFRYTQKGTLIHSHIPFHSQYVFLYTNRFST